MSGQVFRITELNPRLEMEIGGLLESEGLKNRYSSDCHLFGIFDSDGSLAGITGAREFEKECLLHFVVSRVLAYVSDRCDSVWVLAVPGSEKYFERFGFGLATTDKIPESVRDSRDLAGIEIASTKVMTLRLPESWQSI